MINIGYKRSCNILNSTKICHGECIYVNDLPLLFSTKRIKWSILLVFAWKTINGHKAFFLTTKCYWDNIEPMHKLYSGCQNRTATPHHI